MGAMESHSAVKSVEFDGPAPNCAKGSIEPDVARHAEGSLGGRPENVNKGGVLETQHVSEEHLDVWTQVLDKKPTYGKHDLKSLGVPTAVQLQVVAGINYFFVFSDGSRAKVFHQPWTQTLEVTQVTRPS